MYCLVTAKMQGFVSKLFCVWTQYGDNRFVFHIQSKYMNSWTRKSIIFALFYTLIQLTCLVYAMQQHQSNA